MPRSKRKQGANGEFRQRLQSRGLAGIHPFDLYGLELSSGAPLAGCRGSPVPELKNLGAKRNKISNRICELLEERHGHVAEGCNDDRDRLLSLNNASQYLQFAKRSNNETARLLRFWISSVTRQDYIRRWPSCNNPGCDRAAENGVDPIGCVAAAEPVSESANPSGVLAEESAIIISSDESSHSEQDKIAANKEPWICICSHEAKTLRRLLRHGKHCERVPESARAKADPIRTNQCQYGCAVERAVSRHERRMHYICLRSGNITLKRYALQSSEPIDPVRYFLHAKVEEREQRSDNLVGALQGNAKPSEAEKLYKLEDSEIAAAARLAIEQHYKEELPFWNASTDTDKDLQPYQHAPVAGPSPRKEAEHINNHVPPSETSSGVVSIEQDPRSGAGSPAVTESDWPVFEQTGNSPAESASRATSISPPGPCSQTTDELNPTTSLISPTSLCHGNSLSERYDQDVFPNDLQYWNDSASYVHSLYESYPIIEPQYGSDHKRKEINSIDHGGNKRIKPTQLERREPNYLNESSLELSLYNHAPPKRTEQHKYEAQNGQFQVATEPELIEYCLDSLQFVMTLPSTIQERRRRPDTSEVFMLAMHGDIQRLDELFRAGLASPWDVSDTRDESLVRWTLRGSLANHACARWLASKGASIDKDSSDHVHDFMTGRKCSDEDATALQFIRYKHDYNWFEEQMFPPIHRIIFSPNEGRSERLQNLLRNNPHAVHEKDHLGRTALDWAATRGDTCSMELLLGHCALYDTMDKEGRSALQHAIESHCFETVQILLEAGANPNPPIPSAIARSSPLSSASFGGLTRQVKLLLKYGADVNRKNPEGRTPLHQAALNNNAQCANLLLEQTDNLMDELGRTGSNAFTAAVVQNSHDVLKVLVAVSKEKEVAPTTSLLPIAAQYGDLDTIRVLSPLAPLAMPDGQTLSDLLRLRTEKTDLQLQWCEAFRALCWPTVTVAGGRNG